MEPIKVSGEKSGIDAGISHINDDHQTIFCFIDKLAKTADDPLNQPYAIGILESFIVFFLEHTIKEEQILQQYLPIKIVEAHSLLHMKELKYLDKSLAVLQKDLSSDNIHSIVKSLTHEFNLHIDRCDREIFQKYLTLKQNSKP